METILDRPDIDPVRSPNKETLFYCLSRMLERASFYGLRAIIVLYMLSESIKMDRTEAIGIYAWFTILIIFSKVIGALIGDLIIGNRKSIIIGGIIQSIGALAFCIPSTTGLYMGLLLVILGSGLYTPNLMSNYGKLYLDRPKLLDSGFGLFYVAVNLGSFLGVFFISYAGEVYGWNIGFLIIAGLMLISLIPISFTNEERKNLSKVLPTNQRIRNIIIAFILIGLFWTIYEIAGIRVYDIQYKLGEISALNIPLIIWSYSNSLLIIPLCIITTIVWANYYTSQIKKLILGFLFGAISYGILFLIPEMPGEQHATLFFASLFFLGISEIHIAPIIYAVLTKFSNPKYLAIMMSLALVPTRLFSIILGPFNEGFSENPLFAIQIGLVAMIIISLSLVSFFFLGRGSSIE